ncbi:MAG: DUF1015 domain-containing protein [Spirochaetales bacterium]|nr:DUF1015 domain-containing protein [Spirochaetales bacterium]
MKIPDKRLEKIGIKIPRILMPGKNTDMQKWAVVACDQYTSELDYWEDVENFIGDSPSTLNLVYPECYLEESNPDKRISKINQYMSTYLKENILIENEPAFFLVKRSTGEDISARYGLMVAIDLEAYDYSKDSTSLIRATEGTIVDRIPPRKKIRINASIELPHILVLIDDPEKRVIEPLVEIIEELEVIYDFDLMKNSGHISGYRVSEPDLIENIVTGLENLADADKFRAKYSKDEILLYAMGDGNHSLATAKATWEEIKKSDNSKNLMNHPARWALVELENIYDNGITFKPIHRVLFNFDKSLFFKEILKSGKYSFKEFNSIADIMIKIETQTKEEHKIGYCDTETMGIITIEKPSATIPAGTIQKIIDSYLKNDKNSYVDYIHGEDVTEKLGKKDKNCGIFLPAVDKDDFFRTVVMDSAFPRKTFSMGEAHEKRFYVESRRIR